MRVVPSPLFDGQPMRRELAQRLAGSRAFSSWRSCSYFADGRSAQANANVLRNPEWSTGATPCLHLVFTSAAQVEEFFVTDRACGDWSSNLCLGGYRVAMEIVSTVEESRNPQSTHHLRVRSTIHLAPDPAPSQATGRAGARRAGQTWAANLRAEGWHRFEPYVHRWGHTLTNARSNEQMPPVTGAHYFPMPSGGDGGCAGVDTMVSSAVNQAVGAYASFVEHVNAGAGMLAGAALGAPVGPGGVVAGASGGTSVGRAQGAMQASIIRSVGGAYAWANGARATGVCLAVAAARDAATPPTGAGPRSPGEVGFQPVSECYTCTESVQLGWGTEVTVEDESGNVIGSSYENGTSSACADASRVNGTDADGDGWCDGPGG